MDERVHQYNSDLQLFSSTLQGNFSYVPHLAENTFYEQHDVKPEDYDSYSLPEWIGCQQMAPNYVEYLLENGISNMQGEMPDQSTGIGCSFTPQESFLCMEAHQVRLSKQQHAEVPVNNHKNTQDRICYQKQRPNEGLDKSAQHQPNMSVSTQAQKKYLRRKASDADRRRRVRISSALDALGDLLPQCKEGNKTNIVDDCVDYIKYLQNQMRELSQNRLGGEPTSNHLMHLEGYGYYLVHDNTATGPLQDNLGKLLELNPSEATKLLESQGLLMMPTTAHN